MRYICVYICVLYIYKYMCMYIYIQSSWRIFWSWRYSCDIEILQHLRASISAATVGCVAVTITFLHWPWLCCSDHDIIEVAIVLLQWLLLCCSGFYLVAVPFTLLQWLLHCYCGCCCSGCYFVAVAVTLLQWLLHCCSGCYVVAVAVTLLQWRCCSGCYIIEVAIVLLQWLLHCCSAHSNSSSIPSHIYTTHPSIHTYMCCTTHSRTFTHALSLSLPIRFSGISNEATHQEGQANFRLEATRAFSRKWPPTLVTLGGSEVLRWVVTHAYVRLDLCVRVTWRLVRETWPTTLWGRQVLRWVMIPLYVWRGSIARVTWPMPP